MRHAGTRPLVRRMQAITKTLVANLDDPTARKSIDPVADAQKRAVDAFLKSKKLPEKVSNDLVQGMQTALSGLTAVSLRMADLLEPSVPAALPGRSSRCRPDSESSSRESFAARNRPRFT